MEEAYKLIGLLASNNVPALLIGERGVGKHSVAKTIHFNSDRKENPFAAIHCEGMSEEFSTGSRRRLGTRDTNRRP